MYSKEVIKKSVIFTIKILLLIIVSRFIDESTKIPGTVCLLVIFLCLYRKLNKNNVNIKEIIFSKKSFKGIIIISCVIIILQILAYIAIYFIGVEYINFYFPNVIIHLFITIFINAAIEEFVFRTTLIEAIRIDIMDNKKYQVLLSSFIFAVYHLIYVNDINGEYGLMIPLFIGTFIAGISMSYIYINSYNFIYVVIIHTIYNFTMNMITLRFNFDNISNVGIYILYGYMAIIFVAVGNIYRNKIINKVV